MDAHFDQVQKARELSRGGQPRNYFAYSTVLDREAFEEWRAQHGYTDFELPDGRLAEARDLGLVFDFPSRWWGGRVASLADAPGRRVFGRVFSISAEDWPIVQHKEGAVTGMCIEREIDVLVAGAPGGAQGGAPVRAVAFVTAPARQSFDGPVSPRFLEALQRGARSAGLPDDYLAELRTLT